MPEMKGSRDERNRPEIYLIFLSGEKPAEYEEIRRKILDASMVFHQITRYVNRQAKPEEIRVRVISMLSEIFPQELSESFVQKTLAMLKDKEMPVPRVTFKLDAPNHVKVISQNLIP